MGKEERMAEASRRIAAAKSASQRAAAQLAAAGAAVAEAEAAAAPQAPPKILLFDGASSSDGAGEGPGAAPSSGWGESSKVTAAGLGSRFPWGGGAAESKGAVGAVVLEQDEAASAASAAAAEQEQQQERAFGAVRGWWESVTGSGDEMDAEVAPPAAPPAAPLNAFFEALGRREHAAPMLLLLSLAAAAADGVAPLLEVSGRARLCALLPAPAASSCWLAPPTPSDPRFVRLPRLIVPFRPSCACRRRTPAAPAAAPCWAVGRRSTCCWRRRRRWWRPPRARPRAWGPAPGSTSPPSSTPCAPS
jgi:hypothetical protein